MESDVSQTFVGAPIAAALVQAEDFIGPTREWTPINEEQESFLSTFYAARAELARFTDDELHAWASKDASELNGILEREGFAIRVPELGRDDFAVVSILDVLVEWLRKGDRAEIDRDGISYPAVRLESFTVVTSPDHPHPIAVLPTKSGDRLCMTVADQARKGFDLLRAIEVIRRAQEPSSARFGSLVFPMVDLDQELELDWVVGMHTIDEGGRPVVVTYGAQQTKLRMNLKGAHVESAAALAMRVARMQPSVTFDLVVDRPFFCWIERDGVSQPILLAYVDEHEWKDPGDL
jgi:hypothetical protein